MNLTIFPIFLLQLSTIFTNNSIYLFQVTLIAKKDYDKSFEFRSSFLIKHPSKNLITTLTFAAARVEVYFVASIEDLSRNMSKEIVLTPQSKSNYCFR